MSELQPLRIVIVDDEAPARSRMRNLFAVCAQDIPLIVTRGAASGRAAR
jgi:two-component system, LytTR family, response regulator AlgR